MEAVSRLKATEIQRIAVPTVGGFHPFLEAKRSEILEVPRRTFKYGETERHKLDVYYPIGLDANYTAPVLVFIYGGGFNSGERTFPEPFDLGYACLGAYFARQGFVTVIPDYRLVPHVKFPGPAEDVRDAIEWIVNNPNNLMIPNSPIPNADLLFVMGHSAGAAHVATMLLLPEILASTDLNSRISGVILNGGGYHFRSLTSDHPSAPIIAQYWGSLEESHQNDVWALLERAPSLTIDELPKILLVEAEREPDWLKAVGKDFKDALEARTGLRIRKIIAAGHNHISPNWALSTGQGEEWAENVVEWMKSE
ncbi:alpha/beta hydrolase domain-containing protein [Crucibulum laeve]|uniref:Alpha/beta hydrolase domain-containing protein n=1 Tax=Crucibulum laeve TaxID=68775 RepID=A0A5C3M0F1_9AGAR|nr:alpha/beta hydrolase domain-containing protein [Crucibulum laeve]